MNNAELYQKNNSLQKRDALDALEEFAKKIRWKKHGDRVIDIGCGDGGITINILKEYMPENFERLVGCDISENMINFANIHHGNERTHFTTLDIEGFLPLTLKNKFDHAFSFYVLHWIKHQETAFTNIYNMLNVGGDCLLVFIGYHPIYEAYRILARNNKWSSWLQDVDRFISPYHDSQDPEKEIKKMMEEIGYINIEVSSKQKVFIYNNPESLKKAVQAINPFKIPLDVFNEYFEDYMDAFRHMIQIREINNNESDIIKFSYNLITVYATK
ncbi:juvenile hormone acid O-methyltransferase [Achroia grisella]|uniref:juvenile hormone acid O-methyltransferase n=1 Tax=Achroia grisella TaxID=688607 RepID=UPI0027D22018|nr:juvenile hormone acid O-methyltransferase [Achroia grisella]